MSKESVNSKNFLKLKELILAAEEDDQKFAKGNVAAGTRLRGFMQDVKKLANDVRTEVLAERAKGKEKK